MEATRILRALLDGLGPIWLTGSMLDGVPLGDAWRHPHAGGQGATAGWVPFHKLSQWLAYSLFEPFEWAGVAVGGRDALTALPEYRNGGLLLDTGVLALRDSADAVKTFAVGSELVVEWRALTVTLLDELAPRVRALLAAPTLPLACILEGGTWAAGTAAGAGKPRRCASPRHRQRRDRFLAISFVTLRTAHAGQSAPLRPPARAAQADAAAQEGDQHHQLSPPAERDRLA